MAIIQRCMFVEGIGNVHALGPTDGPPEHFAALDGPDDIGKTMRAVDIISGDDSEGRILWSVRFREKDPG